MCAYSKAGQFEVGQKVEARYGGKHKWYGGSIVKDNGDGTYAVRYDDGDSDATAQFVRALVKEEEDEKSSAESPSPDAQYKEGDAVQGLFGGKNKYYGGRIVKDNGNDTFEVLYDDGDTEK